MSERDDRPDDDDSPLRSLGATLGGWARRVGELVADQVSGAPTVPEHLREPLAHARSLRFAGDRDEARALLRERLAAEPDQPLLHLALLLTAVHGTVLDEAQTAVLDELAGHLAADGPLGPAPAHLCSAAAHVTAGRLDDALDEIRRGLRDMERLPRDDAHEATFLLHLLGALTHARRGHEDRALRELYKARVRLGGDGSAPVQRRILRLGVDLLLVAGNTRDATTWLRDLAGDDLDAPGVRRLHARVRAAAGDRIGAQALLSELGDDDADLAARVRVGLCIGADDLPALALRHLQADADDPARRRLWALAELATADAAPPADARARELVAALVDAAGAAPAGLRDRHVHELAHVLLRLDRLEPSALVPIGARIEGDPATAAEELRLCRARDRIARDDPARDEDFTTGPPPQFRERPEAGGAFGPAAGSPLRDAGRRRDLLASQRALTTAEYCLAIGQHEAASDLLVAALVEQPGLQRAHALLAGLARPPSAARLEDVLAAATSKLAAIPGRVLGIPLTDVEGGLSQVIAARERLARPLTIAIMGEFSSGKSTFVNALLGESVAPMGVLPTTTTINVFRRGTSGGARVHYRDGRIATLAPGDIVPFLHGLDDTEASRIRHVEIERTGARMGDAAVVDTPGLNALDAFHEQVAREFLDEADAVVWVFSATRSGAASEAGMLASLRAGGRQVLGVLNKVDTLEPAEQDELTAYLRDQLGEVLVDVVPLCATKALEARVAGADDDPFAAVEAALERHFLTRARELKRRLTARRLVEALELAGAAVDGAITQLEERAHAVAEATAGATDPQAVLERFAQGVHDELLDLDDALGREAMALGLVRTGKGLVQTTLEPQDADYLEAFVRDAAFAVLQRSLDDVTRDDGGDVVGEVLERSFLPWARGYLDGELDSGFVARILVERGGAAAQGETALRAELRAGLVPMADAWRGQAAALDRELARVVGRRRAHAQSAPQAEAVRLRVAERTGIDGLIAAARRLER